jgi:hypothetical protein
LNINPGKAETAKPEINSVAGKTNTFELKPFEVLTFDATAN